MSEPSQDETPLKKYRGWKAIADALECSVRFAQELVLPRANGRLPLPVEVDHKGVFILEKALALWKRMETVPYLKHRELQKARRSTSSDNTEASHTRAIGGAVGKSKDTEAA